MPRQEVPAPPLSVGSGPLGRVGCTEAEDGELETRDQEGIEEGRIKEDRTRGGEVLGGPTLAVVGGAGLEVVGGGVEGTSTEGWGLGLCLLWSMAVLADFRGLAKRTLVGR